MSFDLVSKCLELDAECSGGAMGKTKKKAASQAMNTNRKGVWRELRKEKKKQAKASAEKRKQKAFKSAIEIYREQQNVDKTEANIEVLRKIDELGKVSDYYADKLLHKHPCQLSKDLPKEKKVVEESTVFTEEDFAKFEKEYVGKSKR